MAIYKLEEIFEIKRGNIINETFVKKNKGFFPVISSNTLNKGIFGYINSFMYEGEFITMSADGAYAGTVFFQKGKFSITNVCFIFLPKVKDLFISKYLFYILKHDEDKNKRKSIVGSSRPAVRANFIKNINIFLPSLEDQQKIIDIIEPLEKFEILINKINEKFSEFIKNLPTNEQYFYLNSCTELKNNNPKGIQQLSAKVLQKRNVLINNFERKNTYLTNSFYCETNTLVINSIRAYLEKFTILCENADVNGTMFQFNVKKNHTSIIYNLLNNDFWSQANNLSHGTKMPVLSKDSILNKIKFNESKIEINNLFSIYGNLNKLNQYVIKLRNNLVIYLIK